jgi:hypothetical protein
VGWGGQGGVCQDSGEPGKSSFKTIFPLRSVRSIDRRRAVVPFWMWKFAVLGWVSRRLNRGPRHWGARRILKHFICNEEHGMRASKNPGSEARIWGASWGCWPAFGPA